MNEPGPAVPLSAPPDLPKRSDPPTLLLEARDLHKSYTIGRRALDVLCGVSLGVGRGEFLALRGASGAGKSTLLHLLGGLDVPNRGEIIFAGQALAGLSGLALAR